MTPFHAVGISFKYTPLRILVNIGTWPEQLTKVVERIATEAQVLIFEKSIESSWKALVNWCE